MAGNRLDTELLITAGVAGLPHIERLIDSIEEAGGDTNQLREATEALSNEWDNLSADEQASMLRQLGNAANQSAEDVGLLGRQTDRATSTFDRLKGAALKLGAALGVTFVADKVKDFFTGAISGAADFEQQLATVQSVSKATVEEMAQIKAVSEELGKSTRYNSTEAAQGFEILARAGLNARQAIETIPSVLALAQGNGLELADAAGFITKAVQGMGMEFSEAGRVADVLAAAAASANTDVQGMGAALSYAAPSAAALGLSIEETAAYIGKFADAGIDASRAGTSFNAMLSQFSNNASSFRRELANIGITTDNFGEAIAQLAEAGPRGQRAINALGQEAGPALKALLSQGIGSLDELQTKLYEATGAAQEQADAMNSTWQGALNGLKSAWDTLKKNIGEPFLASMTNDFGRLTEMINGLVNSGKIKELGDSFAKVFSEGATALIDYISNMDVSATVDKVSASMETLGKVGTGLNGAFQAISIFMNGIKSGVLVLGTAIAATAELHIAFIKSLIDSARVAGNAFDISTEGLDKLSNSLGEIKTATSDFRSFAVEEIAKSGESINASFDSISGKADETASSIENLRETTSTANAGMVTALQGIIKWTEATGANTEQQMKMVRSSVLDMLESFDDLEQFEDLKNAIIEVGLESEVGADLMKLMGNATIENAKKAKDAIIGLGTAAEQTAAKAQQTITATFDALDINLDQSLTGINSKTQQTFDLIATGAKSVGESAYSAADKTKILSDLFAKGLNTAKTKEEFAELERITRQYGLSAAATSTQNQILQAGMQGGAEAAQAAATALEQQNPIFAENTIAAQNNADAKNSQAKATQAAAESEKALADATATSTQNMARGTPVFIANAAQKISALTELGASIQQVNAVQSQFNKDLDSMGGNTFYQIISNTQNLTASLDAQIQRFRDTKTAAIDATQALSGTSFTSNELTRAQHELERATRASIDGLVDMDSQTLSNLRSAIDSAKDKMKALAEDARKTVENLEITLARTKGEESKAREIEQARKITELEKRITESKERGNTEEQKQLEKALELQKKINKEEDKKARQREAEQRRREQRAKRNAQRYSEPVPVSPPAPAPAQEPAKQTSQPSSQNYSSAQSITASDVAKAVRNEINQAREETIEEAVQRFAKQIIDEFKGRPE